MQKQPLSPEAVKHLWFYWKLKGEILKLKLDFLQIKI